ncbi:MAG TPA: hypothetical protein VMV44_05960 [Rectinemataceae bacterium]|nr:hypothetical protein [Rectinemataceae bacterium]
MGDDNEIRQLIHREAEDFLSKARDATKDIREVYDLEKEFAKTHKNRSLMIPLVTLATLLVLGGIAWGVTYWIQAANNAAPVDVASFDDLNLKDLLDTAKRNENDMASAQSDLHQLQFDLRSSLDAADQEYESNIENIKARVVRPAEVTKQSAAAKAARDAKKRAVQASFAPRMAAKNAEIAAIQAKIDSYDQRLMQQAQAQQAVLDSANKKFDLERKSLVSDYEKRLADVVARRKSDIAALNTQRARLVASLTVRYNPVFTDQRMQSLLAGWKAPSTYGPYAALPAYLATAGVLSAEDQAKLDASLSDFGYIAEQLRQVPWINSVPDALSRLESEGLQSATLYRSSLAAAAAAIEARDKTIAALTDRAVAAETARDRLRWAVGSYADIRREAGFVVDPRDSSGVVLVMSPLVPVPDGASAFVLRGDKTIATLRISSRGDEKIGVVQSLVDGQSILPFDSVLVGPVPVPAP